jgi:glutamate racemase
MSKIGVFDSGIGGLSVLRAIEKALPDDSAIWLSDKENFPYGDKSRIQMLDLVVPKLTALVSDGCDVIVIACNSISTNLIDELRQEISVPLIGIEPMIKPAVTKTKTGIIAVCATPATLSSPRYQWLKTTYAPGITVLEPDCSKWAYMIEHDQINEKLIAQQINKLCDLQADVIVLGCTHYHWIETTIRQVADRRAIVIQPEQPVISQLRRLLGRS